MRITIRTLLLKTRLFLLATLLAQGAVVSQPWDYPEKMDIDYYFAHKDSIDKYLAGKITGSKVIDGDTVMHAYLREVIVRPPFEFKSRSQRRRYSRLVRYVKKVYPYSQMIRKKFEEIEKGLDTIPTEKARKAFIKAREKELRKQFENKLVKLTIIQGRILMKLVDRETDHTTYELLEGYKGKFSAVFWQSVARIFGSDLKKGYDKSGDDKMIEDIIIRIENGQL